RPRRERLDAAPAKGLRERVVARRDLAGDSFDQHAPSDELLPIPAVDLKGDPTIWRAPEPRTRGGAEDHDRSVPRVVDGQDLDFGAVLQGYSPQAGGMQELEAPLFVEHLDRVVSGSQRLVHDASPC